MRSSHRQSNREDESSCSSATPVRDVGCFSDSHSLATAALCCCSFTNAFLMISVFPYAGYMVLDLVPTATTENSGFFAGFIAGSFYAARFVTVYQWGRLADACGRTLTLKFALGLSGVFSILFGCSKTLRAAILWRGCMGMSNCIASTVRTVATEIAVEEKLQRRTMGLVVGMRSWGMLVAPAIAGFLAEPVRQYADWFFEKESSSSSSQTLLQSSWLLQILEIYPFLLPNMFGAGCCLIAATAIHYLVPETLHKEASPSSLVVPVANYVNQTQSELLQVRETTPLLIKHVSGSLDMAAANIDDTQQFVWSRLLTRELMVANWLFSVVSSYVDEAFPLFCMSVTGGLALRESGMGAVLSGAGLIFALLQYATFATITHRYGLYRSLTFGCWLGTLPVAFVPLSIVLRRNRTKFFMWFLSIVLGFTKLMHSLYYTSMAVAINKAVHSSQRARMNALVLTGSSIGKAFGPFLAGGLATFSFSSVLFPAEYGSLLVWSMVPIMGLVVALRIRRLSQLVLDTGTE